MELDAEYEKSRYESDLKKIQIVHEALKEQVLSSFNKISKHISPSMIYSNPVQSVVLIPISNQHLLTSVVDVHRVDTIRPPHFHSNVLL